MSDAANADTGLTALFVRRPVLAFVLNTLIIVAGLAAFNGVVIIRRIEFDDGAWKIEGRDRSDRRVEMTIDPETGEVAQLERFD